MSPQIEVQNLPVLFSFAIDKALTMTIIGYILGTVLSYWSWIAFAAIVAMTIKWYLLSAKKEVVDPFLGVPEIKPHWFWGNLGSIFGEDHFVVYYMKHYTV